MSVPRLVYDLARRPGQRLVSAVVQCEDTPGAGAGCGEVEDGSSYSLVHRETRRYLAVEISRYLAV